MIKDVLSQAGPILHMELLYSAQLFVTVRRECPDSESGSPWHPAVVPRIEAHVRKAHSW
jgi:hypothetical protein